MIGQPEVWETFSGFHSLGGTRFTIGGGRRRRKRRRKAMIWGRPSTHYPIWYNNGSDQEAMDICLSYVPLPKWVPILDGKREEEELDTCSF